MKDIIAKETIGYLFGVLYVMTVMEIQNNPDYYRTAKLRFLEATVYGARYISRRLITVGDMALDAYRREINGDASV